MIVTIHARPGASTNALSWLDDSTAKATVTAIAEKGKANEAIIELLSRHYNISKSRICLMRGATTRIKQFRVDL